MNRTFTYNITKESAGMTIFNFLKSLDFSTKNIITLKKIERSILVNGIWEYVTYTLKEDDLLVITYTETTFSEKIIKVPLAFEIIYEDEDLLVINKPSNMPIHPSFKNFENSLANGIAYYLSQKGEDLFTYRCINRLDKDTSGLTIIAKHEISAAILNKQMIEHKIKRWYLAFVEGVPTKRQNTITLPIGRKMHSSIERCIDHSNGESAITTYKVIKECTNYSIVLLRLKTGRTHQIRVHMKAINHPLLGDYIYNPTNTALNHHALHAVTLCFKHPITKKPLSFRAPLPKELEDLI
ncbi:MAG: RluA family pseudouridine synthase [Lachnospiraceae bacterium]